MIGGGYRGSSVPCIRDDIPELVPHTTVAAIDDKAAHLLGGASDCFGSARSESPAWGTDNAVTLAGSPGGRPKPARPQLATSVPS